MERYKDRLPKDFKPKDEKDKIEKTHSTIQGMLLEIGNTKEKIKDTYTNDKRQIFQNKYLRNLATIEAVPPFTYKKIINRSVRFFDVIWFNRRGFPDKIFEVEHSTDFRDAFIKFMELQDFVSEFICISEKERKDKLKLRLVKTLFLQSKIELDF